MELAFTVKAGPGCLPLEQVTDTQILQKTPEVLVRTQDHMIEPIPSKAAQCLRLRQTTGDRGSLDQGDSHPLALQPERQSHPQDAAAYDGDLLDGSAVRLNLLGHNSLPGLGSIGPAEAAARRPSARIG